MVSHIHVSSIHEIRLELTCVVFSAFWRPWMVEIKERSPSPAGGFAMFMYKFVI